MIQQSPKISNRRELFDYFEEQMNSSYHQVLENKRLETETTYLKTFILEFDWSQTKSNQNEIEFLTRSLTIPAKANKRNECVPKILDTSEEGFYIVDWNRAKTNLCIYLDTISDPKRRFWIAYSLSNATELDIVMDRLSASQAAFDRIWLWPERLKEIQKKGEFRGVGLDYDYRKFELRSGNLDSTNYLKIQIWGGPKTEEILDYISNKESFSRIAVLGKIRMKYWNDTDIRDQFALEDLKYNGKFTTRGTSFGTHQSLVSNLRSDYSEKIQQIEKKHIIKAYNENGKEGFEIDGDPIFFNFGNNPIENLDVFCEVTFSGHLPFRLWGITRHIPGNKHGRSVSAVDLHTGSKLFFEVYNDFICMYLYPDSCGNTIARFFTNLQHAFSRLITGEDNEGTRIF